MVKETKFRHHPVRLQESLYLGLQQLDIVGVNLDFQDAVLTDEDDVSTQTDWIIMKIGDLAATAGGTVPANAIAVILDVKVKDDGVGDYYMQFASVEHASDGAGAWTGQQPGKTETVYIGQGADRWGSRTIIMELSEDVCILTKVTGVNLDYSINLIGWLIGGTLVSKVTWPYVDLYAKFTI